MNKLTFTQFSKEILESGDIDPDYWFMRKIAKQQEFSKQQLLNWILLKVCIYRSVSELEIIFKAGQLNMATWFQKVKYGNERNKAKNRAFEYYCNISSFFSAFKLDNSNKATLFDHISLVTGFGPWARWKLVDLLSCVYGYHVPLEGIDFREAYEFPLKGLLVVNGYEENDQSMGWLIGADPDMYNDCMKDAWKQMPKVSKTPHNNNAGIRINELETCLCKYHSYIHGHYYPGKDIEHLKKDIAESDLPQLKNFRWSI